MMKDLKNLKRITGLKWIIFMILILMSFPLLAITQLQGLQVVSSDWSYEKDQEQQKEAIRTIIQQAFEQNYNAIFFEVREAGESFFPNPDGSWSSMLNEVDPGFDPLQFAINEAKKTGIQIYAQFDVLTAYSKVNKPQSADHLFQKKAQSWILKTDQDEYIDANAAYFLDPSNPEVLSYLKEQVNYLVSNYQIDGLFFTQVIYPSDKVLQTTSFKNAYSAVKDFVNMDEIAYAQQILTSCLEAVVSEAKLIKPYLCISAEAEPLKEYSKSFKEVEPANTFHFQDAISWLENGTVDVIIPRLHTRSKSFSSLYNLYAQSTELSEYVLASLKGDVDLYRESDVKKAIDYLQKKENKGALVYSATEALKGKMLFEEKADLPYITRTHNASKAIELDMDGQGVIENIVYSEYDSSFHLLDAQSTLSFMLPTLPNSIKLKTINLQMRFQTRDWVVPYRYDLISNIRVQRHDAFIELRKAPSFITTDSSFAFLFRASEGETKINGETIEPYSNTRIFWKEIPFNPLGFLTYVRGSVSNNDETIFYEDVFLGNFPDTTTKHVVILDSVSPQDTVYLPPHEALRFSFSTMLADQLDTILFYANGKPLPLCYNGKKYVGEVPEDMFPVKSKVYLQVAARDINGKDYSYDLPLALKIVPKAAFPLLETKVDFAQVSYALGEVRLGGPYMNEYPQGVRFVSDGKFGTNYRLKLSETEYGYIPENEVKMLPIGTPRPQYNMMNLHVKSDSSLDILTIPWLEPVPYTVIPQPDLNRIRIRLYGVHSNSTWLTHLQGLQVIEYVTWEQADAETYDIYVYLKDNDIWGYDLIQNEKSLSFTMKHPPKREDLIIAIEAGHGGDWNWGAVGLSGLKEKNINQDTAERVRDILTAKGYKVVEIRPGDSDLKLRDRWLLTNETKADIFVSIHANAAGGDYLRVSGTSTYYHNPFWRSFAELAYEKLLELDLNEFGVIGSFNYMMCRMTQRPSMLVEQAFMSHAEDENKLADPEFRQQIAEKVADTIIEYVDEKLLR